MFNKAQMSNTPHNPNLRQTNVISCFSEHHSYFTLPTKGKRLAFQKGWEAKQKGQSSKDCPYEPRIKNHFPTNSYYKHWHLGYECCQNSL